MGSTVSSRTLDSFHQASQIDEQALHELLESSDAIERVWAVWGLVLRASQDVWPLATHLKGDPDPGVRRALAVVLAGQEQVDLLVALSRHDPDTHVRASAAQLVLRFAAAGRVPWSTVLERFNDEPEVCEALLGQIGSLTPPELRTAALACLNDNSAAVRLEAFETAVRLHMAQQLPASVLRDWLNQASPEERDSALTRWLGLAPQSSLVHALADASSAVRKQAIRRVPSRVLADVLPLVENDAELFDHLAYEFGFKLADAPTTLVVQLAARGNAAVWHLTEAEHRLGELQRSVPELSAFLPALRGQCGKHLKELDEVLASPEAWEEYEWDMSREELADHRALVCRLHAHVVRLMRDENRAA